MNPELPEPDVSYEAARDDRDLRYAYSDDAMRAFYAEGFRAGMERAAVIGDGFAKRDFPWGSENSDRYHAQADWAYLLVGAIRAEAAKP